MTSSTVRPPGIAQHSRWSRCLTARTLACVLPCAEVQGSRFYACSMTLRRANTVSDVLSLLPLWCIMLYHFQVNLSDESYITLLLSIIAYKFTLKDELEDKSFTFVDVMIFGMVATNLIIYLLKELSHEDVANYVLGGILVANFFSTLFIVSTHYIKASEMIKGRKAVDNPDRTVPPEAYDQKTAIQLTATLLEKLYEANFSHDFKESLADSDMGVSDVTQRATERYDEASAHLERLAAATNRVSQGEKGRELLAPVVWEVKPKDSIKRSMEEVRSAGRSCVCVGRSMHCSATSVSACPAPLTARCPCRVALSTISSARACTLRIW
jgi:hypothetical protein